MSKVGKDDGGAAFVGEFCWRPATIATFLGAGAEASTQSALLKLETFNEEAEVWDTIKLRLMLWPAEDPAAVVPAAEAAAPESGALAPARMLQQHRMVVQVVGGITSSQVYQISLHTIEPTYQVHVAVPDHRMPRVESRETFHKWHPLFAGLRAKPRVRVLVRVKADGTGPLGDMCGCC